MVNSGEINKKELESCDGLILVIYEKSASSVWVKDEVSWAVEKRPGHLLPILYSTCNLLDFHIRLSCIQYIDYCRDEKKARTSLIRLLKGLEGVESRIYTVKDRWEEMQISKLAQMTNQLNFQLSSKNIQWSKEESKEQ